MPQMVLIRSPHHTWKWSQLCPLWGDIALCRFAEVPAVIQPVSPHLRALACHSTGYHRQATHTNPHWHKSYGTEEALGHNREGRCAIGLYGFPAIPIWLPSFEPVGLKPDRERAEAIPAAIQGVSTITFGVSSLQRVQNPLGIAGNLVHSLHFSQPAHWGTKWLVYHVSSAVQANQILYCWHAGGKQITSLDRYSVYPDLMEPLLLLRELRQAPSTTLNGLCLALSCELERDISRDGSWYHHFLPSPWAIQHQQLGPAIGKCHPEREEWLVGIGSMFSGKQQLCRHQSQYVSSELAPELSPRGCSICTTSTVCPWPALQ